jgi:hypothetical protein
LPSRLGRVLPLVLSVRNPRCKRCHLASTPDTVGKFPPPSISREK